MLKKLIALTLTAVFILSCFSLSVSAAGRNYRYEDACLKLLTDLGIIDGANNATPDVYITRADAAKMFEGIFKINGFEGKAIFNDVDATMDCYDAVSLLCDMGIISKADLFRPDDLISMNEFITMAVNSIGLGSPARESGQWPQGHMEVALKEGLLKSVYLNGDGVMLSQAAIVIANVLECEVKDYGDYGYYTYGRSLLEHVFNTYRKVGVVTDNGITALTGKTKLQKNQIAIDGEAFKTDDISEDYLGYYVEAYYRKNSGADMNELIAVAPVADENYVTEFKYDEITYDGGKYTYYDGKTKKSISVQPETAIVYNGKALTSSQYADGSLYKMKPDYGMVRVLSNTGSKGDVNVLFIDNYVNVLTKKYNSVDNVITSYNDAKNVELADKEYRISDKNGKALGVSALTDKKPLLVAESIDGEFVKIIADGSAVTGEILSVVNSGDSEQYRIGGGVFGSAMGFDKELTAGTCGTFYLDAFGNIFYFDDDTASSSILGYVIDYTVSEKGLNKDILVKIHTQFDLTQILKIADKVEIDDTVYKSKTQKDGILLRLADCKEKVILFSQNVKSEITAIDTANDSTPDGFQMISGMDGTKAVQYYLETGLLGGRAVCSDDTVFFMVPNSGTDGEYVACSRAQFEKIDTRTSAQREGIQAYVNGEDSVRVTALVQRADYTGLAVAVARASFVQDITQSMKEDETPCYELTLTCRGLTSTYKTEDESVFTDITRGDGKEPYTLGKGDIICFGLNRNGEITRDADGNSSVKVLYSAKDKYFETSTGINSAYSSNYIVNDNFKRIYVYDSTDFDGYYKCTFKDPRVNTIESDDVYLYKLDSFSTVLSYDKERNVAGSGVINNLKTYKDYPNDCSECVFFAYDFDFGNSNYAFIAIYE